MFSGEDKHEQGRRRGGDALAGRVARQRAHESEAVPHGCVSERGLRSGEPAAFGATSVPAQLVTHSHFTDEKNETQIYLPKLNSLSKV